MRSSARETVFKFLFAKLFNPQDDELFTAIARDEKLSEKDFDFAKKLLKTVQDGFDGFMSDIERLVKGYKLDRVYNTDKCILIIGMAELKNFIDTPVPVIIDEEVKLAAKYSTDKSTDFVNGILAEYAQEVRNG